MGYLVPILPQDLDEPLRGYAIGEDRIAARRSAVDVVHRATDEHPSTPRLARAQFGIQDSARWPTVAADASGTPQLAPSGLSASENQTSSLYRAGLSVPPWEIDLWGRLSSLSDAALRNAESTAQLQRFVQGGLVTQVALGWLSLLEYDQALEISRRTAQSRVESLPIVRLRFDAGVVSMVDVTQAETSLAQAQAAIAQLQLQRGLQENALSVLVGRNPGPIQPALQLANYELPSALPAGIPARLLVRRPDIRAAELVPSPPDCRRPSSCRRRQC